MTMVRVAKAKQMRWLLSTCPPGDRAKGAESVVERVGVNGRGITLLASREEIAGCDRNPRARAVYRPRCSIAGWPFRDGRVSDGRLEICVGRDQRAVIAFVWINALSHARWIVVDQPGFREVYPVAAGLPVRVSTVSEIGSPTVFHTAQYDARGVLLARRRVTASIAS
jgi:hypothetical protein